MKKIHLLNNIYVKVEDKYMKEIRLDLGEGHGKYERVTFEPQTEVFIAYLAMLHSIS